MPAPPVGTPVSVLTTAPGYEIRVPGVVVMNLASWTGDAENDLPEPLDEDRAHILLTVMVQGNPVYPFLANALPGAAQDQYNVLS